MKQTTINNIQNDLRRVSKWAAELDKELPQSQIQIFMAHAIKDFSQLNKKRYVDLFTELQELAQQQKQTANNPLTRLRWAEKILTISCRLY